MQGMKENILTATDKLNGFKLKLWQEILKNKNTDMFPLTAEDPARQTPVLLKSIAAHLKMLQERFEFYFHADNENFDSLIGIGKDVANQIARRTGGKEN